MPTTTRVRIDGLRELGQAMSELATDIAKRVASQATYAGAKPIRAAAKQNIQASPSVQTGDLLSAVIIKKLPRGELEGQTSAHVVTVRGRGKPANKKGQRIARAPHASLVEFGTVHMPAEPFLRPAFEQHNGEAAKAIADRLRQRISQVKPK
jgi:HK97 gp10 family phage protein